METAEGRTETGISNRIECRHGRVFYRLNIGDASLETLDVRTPEKTFDDVFRSLQNVEKRTDLKHKKEIHHLLSLKLEVMGAITS